MKYLPEVVFTDSKLELLNSLKDSNFCENEMYPNYALLVKFWPLVSPWKWPKSRKIKNIGKNSVIRLSKYVKVKPLSPQKRITFWTFWTFLSKKKVWSKIKISESKCNIANAGAINYGLLNKKTVWSHHFPDLSFRKILTYIFKFTCCSTKVRNVCILNEN